MTLTAEPSGRGHALEGGDLAGQGVGHGVELGERRRVALVDEGGGGARLLEPRGEAVEHGAQRVGVVGQGDPVILPTVPADHALVPDVERIAVLRANGLGDLVFVLPALDALRAAYPGAELVLLAGRWQRELLKARPGPVDRVVEVPVAGGVREGAEEDHTTLERFFAAMVRERFDLALQLHGGGRFSNPFVKRLGARVTVGSRSPDAAALDRSLPYVYLQPEVARYLELVGLVGAAPVTLAPRLPVTEADRAEAAAAVGAPRSVVALHPGATDPRRRWRPERFAAVGDALAELGATVAVTGSPPEQQVVDAVLGHMRRAALDLCGRLTLGGLAGLLERCAVVVSNDSGPLHLAAAVGAPTVGIFWGPNVVNSPPLHRARHRPLAALARRCAACGTDNLRGRCAHALLDEVAVAEVVAAARELLGAPAVDAPALERALDPRA
jgi:ADP-heptose:LPS heptosyltransferase